MRDSGSPRLGCREWRSPRCRCGASRPGPCGSCDDEKEDHFDGAAEDVVDPGFADERQHHGDCVDHAGDDVGCSVYLCWSEEGDDDHEAWDQNVDRDEDKKGLVDFEARAGDLLEEWPR
jgi:hypothetical protein